MFPEVAALFKMDFQKAMEQIEEEKKKIEEANGQIEE